MNKPLPFALVLSLLCLPLSTPLLGCTGLTTTDGGDAEGADGGDGDGDGERPDGGGGDGDGDGDGDPQCDLGALRPEDDDRIVLVSFTFTDTPGVPGTEIGSFTLSAAGQLGTNGFRLDVGTRVVRLAFTPDGRYAIAVGEDGLLVSLDVDDANTITVIDSLEIPGNGFGAPLILPAPFGAGILLPSGDNQMEGGLLPIDLYCDGTLALRDGLSGGNLRLTFSVHHGATANQLYVVGGQAFFDPIDHDDTRLWSVNGEGFTELSAFDFWADFFNTGRAGVYGDTLVMANTSAFSDEAGHVVVVQESTPGTLTEVARLTDGFASPREVHFAPDGSVALITSDFENRIYVLGKSAEGTWSKVDEITGVGLADQLAGVARGQAEGLFIAPAVNDVPNLHLVHVRGGVVGDEGRFDIGAGSENIPLAIAVQP